MILESVRNTRNFYAGYCSDGAEMQLCKIWTVKEFTKKSDRDNYVQNEHDFCKMGELYKTRRLTYTEMCMCKK